MIQFLATNDLAYMASIGGMSSLITFLILEYRRMP